MRTLPNRFSTLCLLTGLAGAALAQPAHAQAAKQSRASAARPHLGKVLGADISFLPQLEARGMKFSDKGVEKDAIQILKDHHINYIRLRIFNNPAADSGYSPHKGFCDLPHTLAMAKRVKQAGLKLLLDFHYSDTWADPQKQFKPLAWRELHGPALAQAVHDYTKEVLLALQAQGTLPDMVQVGNEINHGMLWPDAQVQLSDSLARYDTLARLAQAGASAVREVNPKTLVMLHIALGGQAALSNAWLDRMQAHKVDFDVIGESYYPKWHGTIPDLTANLNQLARRYPQDIVVVEYSERKREVNAAVFSVPGGRGKGSFIWEPLNTWEAVFDKQGKANDLLPLYDEISKQYQIH
ncbi:arabinogalactan endo-beta-1,4-galactanase [Hymenobacter sp. BRD67]|uniref:glycoside hydrolase family 53 protein n=1 Tax=Hymenobacter sp. BRD67 TaxID=2675877 RepID=UPI0015652FBC|nr:glycosyl hydrolase 53 family protein [Hymenobacter sp. BRD67]QKG52483.1 glycosyl hydrolase 53 family protein [Hymenobacter sp. BRD67]